ncbi:MULTISPECIES: SH3 domain-containing protein [unclassified Leptolyngbya]|uniref:SH3 domain-containing protein n=1 Tax=unclassified Leptolyngbya TaxID=2650499 RepID=UPI00168660AF|nr:MULTISPECIES: SH3 domain-containing protein [unclassified Leptolyngbya]MBD1911127.1 SH3 domain-containing protein [Leptolyngbya sp. FACHB-8]MBD2154326.1 SH3 domain-containing protein [Leptolyngbya sp. FACHB-16]
MAGVAKFFLGFVLAIAILFFAGVTTARYMITRLTAPPPRPVFPNDNPIPPEAEASPKPSATPAPEASSEAAAPSASPSPSVSPSPSASPSPSPSMARARVTQPIGLVLRSDASQSSEQLGGVDFNTEVEILGTSPDGQWQQVRTAAGQEGWIKAGNTEAIQ